MNSTNTTEIELEEAIQHLDAIMMAKDITPEQYKQLWDRRLELATELTQLRKK